MKNTLLTVAILGLFLNCKDTPKEAKASTPEIEADKSISSEWTILFDGSSLDQWQAYGGGETPKYWSIEGDALVFNPPSEEERKADGDKEYNSFNIVTKDSFENFELSLEWKISEAGNSGIFWGIEEAEKYSEPYQSALEIQVLDNEKHPDAKNGTTHQAGALYDLVAPSEDATSAVGEWNKAIISINHKTNTGTSSLNGVVIATFPVNGENLDSLIKGSKFDGWDGFAQYQMGKIGLQDHNDLVSFRNIKIKEL